MIKKHRNPHRLPARTCLTQLQKLSMNLISTAEDLEREIGDSEAWDEASEDEDRPIKALRFRSDAVT